MPKKPKHKLPRTLQVVHRYEASTEFFIADKTSDDFIDGEFVGVYTLTSVGTKRVRHTVE